MFRFASPQYFLLLIPLGVAVWRVYRRRVGHALVFAPLARVRSVRASWRARLAALAPPLFLAGLVLGIIALARPQTVLSRSTRRTNAIAIEMVVDVSGSMEALDFSTRTRYVSRLDVVKKTFESFIDRRPGDLIGLVTFGGYAVTRAPLTLDHDALRHVLRGVQIPKGRDQEELLTAIGDALATACSRLEPVDVTSRIVVLLSDGESNTGIIKPDAAVKLARSLGIKVYTIGIGTTGIAPVWAKDRAGNKVLTRMRVSLDEALLRDIADRTGARYFNVQNPEGLQQALAHIDKLERTEIEREVYHRYTERVGRPLAASILCILAGSMLGMLLLRRVV